MTMYQLLNKMLQKVSLKINGECVIVIKKENKRLCIHTSFRIDDEVLLIYLENKDGSICT
jgi:hypothetical protein